MKPDSGRQRRSAPPGTDEVESSLSPSNAPAGNLEIVYRATADLVPYAKNARTHSDEQVDQIVASMREFGWTNPILIDSQMAVIAETGETFTQLLAKRRPETVLVAAEG